MPKFSIIVPVYNSSKYLKKCLDSVFNQSFKDYEVIVINDGSTDDSYEVINKLCNKKNNVKYFDYGSNRGLSYARNYGVSKATGEYILFLDSDDYYSDNFLDILNLSIDGCDVLRFQCRDVFDGGTTVEYGEESFDITDGVSSFNKISCFHYVEPACLYCFKRNFWVSNKFKFTENTYHEDFGLIPFILIKSKNTRSISSIGYNYCQRSGSIMNNSDYTKMKKKCYDFFNHFKYLKESSSEVSGDLSIYNSFIANSVILKSTFLKGKDYKQYIKELRKLNVFDMLLTDTLFRRIKKILVSISPKIYYKLVRR